MDLEDGESRFYDMTTVRISNSEYQCLAEVVVMTCPGGFAPLEVLWFVICFSLE